MMPDPAPGAPRCGFCEAPIDPANDYRKVVGYERFHRGGGGTNAIRLRKPVDEWACRWCVDRQAKGLSSTQGSLM